MRLKNLIILLSLFMTFSFSGCISEDTDDCIVNTTRLNFSYLADGDQDVLPQYVNNLTVFIYDSSTGQLIDTKELGLGGKSKAYLELRNLDPGLYSFVVWGNLSGFSELANIDQLSKAAINLKPIKGALQSLVSSDQLYFARKDIEIQKVSNTTIDVLLNSAHVKFDVVVKGLAQMPDLHLSHQIQGFDMNMNEIEGGEVIGLDPVFEKGEKPNLFRGQFSVLRPKVDFLQSKLSITSATAGTHEVILKDFIATHYPHVSVSSTQEIKIDVLFEFSDLGINVSVPDWDIEGDTGSVID